MRPFRAAVLIAIVLGCAHCAGPISRLPDLDKASLQAEQRTEQIAQMRDYYAGVSRVDRVAFRLRVANRPFCHGWESAQIGLHAVTPRSLPHRFRSFASAALAVGWSRPTVISVAEASPAAQAGIRGHDEITALDGELPDAQPNRVLLLSATSMR
jgi:membrane-associated protease RseP (regulator of RpoE activity)